MCCHGKKTDSMCYHRKKERQRVLSGKKTDSMCYHGKKTDSVCYHGKKTDSMCYHGKKDRQQVLSREITFVVPLFYQIVRRFHVPHHISHRASGMKWVNSSTPNVPHDIKTSQWICNENQLTGFYMMGKTGIEWVKRKIVRAEQRHFSKSNSPPWDLLFQNSEVKLL